MARHLIWAVLLVLLPILWGCKAGEAQLRPITISTQEVVSTVVETPATAGTITPSPTALKTVNSIRQSVMEEAVTAGSYCSSLQQPDSHEVVFVNQHVCIFAGKGSLVGAVFVYLVNPQSIAERNLWLDDVGEWLRGRGKDACAQKTVYLTESLSGPLYEQVKSVPGEKAFYSLEGKAKPTFCPNN